MNEKTVTTVIEDDDLEAVTGGVDGSINTGADEKMMISLLDLLKQKQKATIQEATETDLAIRNLSEIKEILESSAKPTLSAK